MRKVLLGAFIALVLLYGGCLAVLAGEADGGATGTGGPRGADAAHDPSVGAPATNPW